MSKLLTIIALIMVCLPCAAVDAITATSSGGFYTILTYDWTADSSGNASGRSTTSVQGILYSAYTEPSTSAVPTDNYDIVVKQTFSTLGGGTTTFTTDLASSLLLNRDTSTPEYVDFGYNSTRLSAMVDIVVTNAGASAKGRTVVTILRNLSGATGSVTDFTVAGDIYVNGGDIYSTGAFLNVDPTGDGKLEVEATTFDIYNSGGITRTFNTSASPTTVGYSMAAYDSGSAYDLFGILNLYLTDRTAGSEDATLKIGLKNAGTLDVDRFEFAYNGDFLAEGDGLFEGGDVTLGVTGTTRGVVIMNRGTSTNTPGYARFESPNGTEYYGFVNDSGVFRVHSAAPTSNTSGVSVTIDPTAPGDIGTTTPATGYFTDVITSGSGVLCYAPDAANGGQIGLEVGSDYDASADVWRLFAGSYGGTDGDFTIERDFSTNTVAFRIDDATLAASFTGPVIHATVTNFTANDTTPTVAAGNIFVVPGTWTAGNNITMFDSGITGQQITIIGGDADCVVTDGSNLVLAGNFTADVGDTLKLVFTGTNWYETGRSNN